MPFAQVIGKIRGIKKRHIAVTPRGARNALCPSTIIMMEFPKNMKISRQGQKEKT